MFRESLKLQQKLVKYKHQELTYDFQQWWQSFMSLVQSSSISPSMYYSIKLLVCHHCWDSYADSWYLCLTGAREKLKH